MSLLSVPGNPYTQEKSCNVMCSLTGVSIGVLFAGLVVTQLQIHGLAPAYMKSKETEILRIIDEKMKQSSNCEVTKTSVFGQVVQISHFIGIYKDGSYFLTSGVL